MNNNIIIRDPTHGSRRPGERRKNCCIVPYETNLPCTSGTNGFFTKRHPKYQSSLPQIAIKMKDSDSPSSVNTEVILLNGNWDTSNTIPNIIAEMHNVSVEELQALQNTWTTKQMESLIQQNNGKCFSPSPQSCDSGIEIDCTEGNLSWLLNYKIHELPPVPDSAAGDQLSSLKNGYNYQGAHLDGNINFNVEDIQYDQQSLLNGNITRVGDKQARGPQNNEDPLKCHTYRYTGPKKPPFTYTELIEHALSEKGELTVSGIYQWISDHFPFYKQNDDRWKNSVRHNLSINPHFRKGSKAVHGAGHLWTIAQREDKKTWNIKKQRMQQFMQTAYNDYAQNKQLEVELAAATASILPENQGLDDYQREYELTKNGFTFNHIPHDHQKKTNHLDVEYVNVIDLSNGLGDFLCPPVSKEEVVEECGLGGDYLITDLNPNSLGLNLSEAEIITSGNLYDELNSDLIHCYELQTE